MTAVIAPPVWHVPPTQPTVEVRNHVYEVPNSGLEHEFSRLATPLPAGAELLAHHNGMAIFKLRGRLRMALPHVASDFEQISIHANYDRIAGAQGPGLYTVLATLSADEDGMVTLPEPLAHQLVEGGEWDPVMLGDGTVYGKPRHLSWSSTSGQSGRLPLEVK